MLKVADSVKTLVLNSMETRKEILCAGNLEILGADIRRGIFQGDSLCLISFNLGLIPLSCILRNAQVS